ncbi:MAG TPA: MFS transporter [Rugosimonospora sp.]|nr:MFS transporter [Rugosimonospora sp.]
MHTRLGSTFRSLQVRNYRLFSIGQLVSLIFGWVQITAQDWLVLQVSHNSGTALGAVTALQFTPILLLSLYAGKLADRFDKRVLLLIVNAAWLVLAAAMGVLVVSGTVTMWQVFVFAALWGSVSAVETPARQSFASEMVEPRLLPNALSLASAAFNTARVIGPALGGVAIAVLGTGTAFLVNAVSYVGPLVALSMMNVAELRRDGLAAGPVKARDARVVDGLRYVWRRGDLLLPLALMLVVGMLGFNFQLTLALLAKTVFHTNAATFGLLTTALAIGALAGALGGAGRRARPSVWVVLGAGVGFGLFETLVGLAPDYLAVALLLIPAGYFMMFLAQAANQRVQLGVEPEMRGRVMALYIMVFLGTNPIGAPLIGWVSQTFGPRSSIWLGGLVSLLVCAVALGARLRMAGGRVRLRVRPTPRFYVVLGEGGVEPAVPVRQAA